MDGLTCTKEKKILELKGAIVGHVPIIAVTANAMKDQTEEAGRAGIVSFAFLFVLLDLFGSLQCDERRCLTWWILKIVLLRSPSGFKPRWR